MNGAKFAQLFQLIISGRDWFSVLILISLKTAIKMHPCRKRSNAAFWRFLVGCCYRKKKTIIMVMKNINSDQHVNISTCPENTIKKVSHIDRYEPMMSTRRALIAIFYVQVSVSHKCEAGVIQLRVETTADVSFPVGRRVMAQLDPVWTLRWSKITDRKQQKSSCFTSLHPV